MPYPHGANNAVQAPLWNRALPTGTYNLYSRELASGQSPTVPGINSLMCLSCHDGTIAIDSVINMPGSGNFLSGQASTVSETFLDSWTNPSGRDTKDHGILGPGGTVPWVLDSHGEPKYADCLSCHPMAWNPVIGGWILTLSPLVLMEPTVIHAMMDPPIKRSI